MGGCVPSKQQRGNTYKVPQRVSQKQKSRSQTQPSQLSGVLEEDQIFFKRRIDNVSGRRRLNLANSSMIDSDLAQLMRCKWIDDIQELNLQNNYITTDGYKLLVSRRWPNLVVLNLSVNKLVQVEGLGQFPKLEIGYFQRNPLSPSGKICLSESNFKNGVFLCWSEDQ